MCVSGPFLHSNSELIEEYMESTRLDFSEVSFAHARIEYQSIRFVLYRFVQAQSLKTLISLNTKGTSLELFILFVFFLYSSPPCHAVGEIWHSLFLPGRVSQKFKIQGPLGLPEKPARAAREEELRNKRWRTCCISPHLEWVTPSA